MRPELDGDGPSARWVIAPQAQGHRAILFLFTSCLFTLCAFVLPDVTVGVEMCAEM